MPHTFVGAGDVVEQTTVSLLGADILVGEGSKDQITSICQVMRNKAGSGDGVTGYCLVAL